MSRDTLSARRTSVGFLIIAITCLLPIACLEQATGTVDEQELGGDRASDIAASIVLSDVSSPEGTTVSGTVRFENLSIELWNGEEWVPATDEPAAVEVTIAGGEADATLIPLPDVPAGTYTKARLTATGAVVDLSLMLGGRKFTHQARTPADVPVALEKEIEVTVNEDGSLTFQLELETVQRVNQQVMGALAVIYGELGGFVIPVNM